jgi:hypothetical protein
MPLNEGVALYRGTFFIASFAFNLLLEAIAHKRRLIHADLEDQVLSPVRKAYRVGPLVYGVSIAIAWWNAGAGLVGWYVAAGDLDSIVLSPGAKAMMTRAGLNGENYGTSIVRGAPPILRSCPRQTTSTSRGAMRYSGATIFFSAMVGSSLFLRRTAGMSNACETHDSRVANSLQAVLVVQGTPADALLTAQAFKAAGLTSGLHSVEDGEEALQLRRSDR